MTYPSSIQTSPCSSDEEKREKSTGRLGRAAGLLLLACLSVSATSCGEAPSVGTDGPSSNGEGSGGTSNNQDKGTDNIDIGDSLGSGGSNDDKGEEEDPCSGPQPPASCNLDYEPSGPGCGDGEINVDGEECDDGNGLPGDGCSGLCIVEPNYVCDDSGCTSSIVCGDGITQAGEVCDDGNLLADDGCGPECLLIETGYTCPAEGGSCEEINPCLTLSPPASCFPPPGSNPYCGDGEVNNSWEECDDGNPVPGDGCNGGCKEEAYWDCSSGDCVFTLVCGNGIVEAGEICDDGSVGAGCEPGCLSITPGYSCPPGGGTCTQVDPCDRPVPPPECQVIVDPTPTAYCGDGNINQLSEDCDDGNTQPGDGCSGACKVEPNWDCTMGSCVSSIVCGDGNRQGGEICDDGNLTGGDGCSDMCATIDPFYNCPPSGGPCASTVVCNDGRITGNEQCEDGNTASGDGCDSECQLEVGYFCPVIGSACSPLPFCGDGEQTPGEQCDDAGSSAPGCSDTCQIESGYVCPEVGQDCIAVSAECGNGSIEGDEQCDDNDSVGGDGCSANCSVEPGYSCTKAGQDCTAICGDGLIRGDEICDDSNTADGDGCDSGCHFEQDFYCDDSEPTTCAPDFCGNGEVGNTEACDGDDPAKGIKCAPDCTAEPSCSNYDANGCSSVCGDGLIIDEECDDGNTKDGDGCDSDCKVELGFTCQQSEACGTLRGWDHDDDDDANDEVSTCVLEIPITYRDFDKSHPHFEPGYNSTGTAGLVVSVLDADGKPDWSGVSDGVIAQGNQAQFDLWYRDSSSSQTHVSKLVLWDRDRDPSASSYSPTAGDVTFVNRYGDEGEKYQGGGQEIYCGNTGECPTTPNYDKLHCTCTNNWNNNPTPDRHVKTGCDETEPDFAGCFLTNGGSQWVTYGGGSEWDGNPAFFPIDDLAGGSPASDYSSADIPSAYGGGTPDGTHNFHFTSEVRRWFQYDRDKEYTLDFSGDDDVWVFLNGRLAVDLGGWHEVQDGTIHIQPGDDITITEKGLARDTDVNEFQLVDGNVYEIVVFQAERKYTASSYRLTLGGFNTNPSSCTTSCGDGIVAGDEECDDGDNDGGYGECQAGCVLGSFCGDGITDSDEECDNGTNLSGWGDTTPDACAPGCVKPKFCGDGEVQPSKGEACDLGTGNSSDPYGGCNLSCQFGDYCGDGRTQVAQGEQCDDGVNDGTAGCGPDCKSTLSCGNGQVEAGEDCDDGVNDGGYGECAPDCLDGPYCGDAFTDTLYSETCDDGINDGSYGGCSSICQLGPYCGDAEVNGTEECDDGVNDGGYGECKQGCNRGDYCGDGRVSGPEECDDGVNDGTKTACESGCTWGPYCGDGSVDSSEGELCDDGSNLGGYNKCGPACTPGPYCGDSIPQPINGEQCDDGDNNGGYGECAENCVLGPFCGDGLVNGAESCDDSINDGSYGRCAPDCTTGSYCGDGIKQPEEQCDDGTNDGTVSSCQQGCVLGAGCGDGVLQEGEQCDLGTGNSTAYNSCLPNVCNWGPRCGDGVVQKPIEQCDDGNNPGGYGECAQNCRLGPYCGDGVVNGGEICDDGVNDGGYGECAPACKLGPYCGDGKVDSDNEMCDDGNRKNGDGCSASCRAEVIPK